MSDIPAETAPDPSRIIPHIEDIHWREKAACKGANEQGYSAYPEDNPEVNARFEKDRFIAKFCIGCTVRSECLVNSVITADPWGVQGGLMGAPDGGERKELIAAYKETGSVPRAVWEAGHEYGQEFLRKGMGGTPRVRKKKEKPAALTALPDAIAPEPVSAAEMRPAPQPAAAEASLSLESLAGRIRARRSLLEQLKQFPRSETIDQRQKLLAEIAEIKQAVFRRGELAG